MLITKLILNDVSRLVKQGYCFPSRDLKSWGRSFQGLWLEKERGSGQKGSPEWQLEGTAAILGGEAVSERWES